VQSKVFKRGINKLSTISKLLGVRSGSLISKTEGKTGKRFSEILTFEIIRHRLSEILGKTIRKLCVRVSGGSISHSLIRKQAGFLIPEVVLVICLEIVRISSI
jgi:hypothetical protein